jgi:hypothetical protein
MCVVERASDDVHSGVRSSGVAAVVGGRQFCPVVNFSVTFVGTERWDQILASGNYFGPFFLVRRSVAGQ